MRASNKVSSTPAFSAEVRTKLFGEVATSTPASFRQFIETDIARWQGFAKHARHVMRTTS